MNEVLGVFLSIGLGLLLAATTTTTRASEHGDHGELPEGCDAMALWRCHVPFNDSDILRPILTENATVVGEDLFKNPEHYKLLCHEWKVSIGCLKRLEDLCLSDFPDHNLTDLLDAEYPVDPVSKQHKEWQEACSSRMLCLSKISNCSDTFPELTQSEPNFTDPYTCPSLKQLKECASSPAHCRSIPENQHMMHGLDLGLSYCDFLKCEPLQQCHSAFFNGGPKDIGLDNRTCFLYHTLTRCVGNTLASDSCPDVPRPRGSPNYIAVSDMVGEACTAMGSDDFNAIYSCPSFTECINETMYGMETTLIVNFCPTVQAVMGCAQRAVGTCLGSLTTEKKQEFESLMKGLMFEAQGMGCGMAHVAAEECAALHSCSQSLNITDADTGFADMCTKVHTFQTCAHGAAQSCNLTDPATPSSHTLHFENLATITEELCTAMENQPLATCPELLDCLGRFGPPKTPVWKLLNTQAWCGYSVSVMECVHSFTGSCSVSGGLKDTLDMIYEDFLGLGCKDMFDYKARNPTEEKTTKPTSGAPSRAAVGWMGMLLSLALLCLL